MRKKYIIEYEDRTAVKETIFLSILRRIVSGFGVKDACRLDGRISYDKLIARMSEDQRDQYNLAKSIKSTLIKQ